MSAPDTNPLLHGFAVVVLVAVAWGEMDAFGHVNNVVYFRYFENARIEYLIRIGLIETRGVGPILATASCRFRRPVTYPDQLLVGVRASAVGEDRFTLEYRLVSSRQEAVAAEGESVVVCYDHEKGRKAPLPPNVRQAIEAIDAR